MPFSIGGRMFERDNSKESAVNRRDQMTYGMLGASVATAGTLLTRIRKSAFGQTLDYSDDGLTKRDIAILKFLLTIELIESDLWQQYDELGGATEGAQNSYQLALQHLDGSCSEYVSSNSIDEIGHATFLRAYLESEGVAPINLDKYRTLRGSTATDANDIGRLTNLMHLEIDKSRYVQTHTAEYIQFRDAVPQIVGIVRRTTIPRTEEDINEPALIQAIANTAVFQFRYFEWGVSSLYTSISRQLRRAKVLKIALGIGAQEIAHSLNWANFGHHAAEGPSTRLDNSETSIKNRGPLLSDFNAPFVGLHLPTIPLIPLRSEFIRDNILLSPVIWPLDDRFGGAVDTIMSFAEDGLFFGQSKELLQELMATAEDADAALRG
jgi:hypothetical protein